MAGICGAGAWGSRDAGQVWMRRSDGLDPMVRRMWDHPERGDRLYAVADSGYYRTDDAKANALLRPSATFNAALSAL